MEDYIMIHITFCYETDLDLTYMKNELQNALNSAASAYPPAAATMLLNY